MYLSCVKLTEEYTEPFITHNGIKQGDSLSPMLFNILIDDVTSVLNKPRCDAPTLSDTPVSCLLYADDTVLISTLTPGL